MAVIKNNKNGMWEVRTYYKDLTGARKQKTKRGFAKKSEALEWERNFKLKENQSISMSFQSFVDIYLTDLEPRIKRNTFLTKKHIIETKILPYFGKRKLDDIRTSDVIQWQNEIMKLKKDNGELFSPTYLKTIHNQLSAILNHAVNMYGLKDNVARKAGTMGKEENKEMEFWTQDEFQAFLECVADKPISYYAFEMLYWTGIREGELLALTPADFNFEKKTLWINKSYQRLEGKDVITDPKTPKSNRTIVMPDFLAVEMEDFISSLYGIRDDDRIFTISKSYLHHEMDRGAKLAGVKRIRIHGLRHSHISLLINLGFSALAIGERVGHEAVDITYHYAHLFPTVQTDMAAQGKGNTEWRQWAEAEKDNIALIMSRYGIDWKKKDTHNMHLSVLDYKKKERAKEVDALEEEIEGAQVVLELKEERIESLEKEIESKRDRFRKEQSETQKKLDDTIAENHKLQSETTDLRLKNSELRLEYYENVDKLTDKQKEVEMAKKEADKWMMISDTAKLQTERAEFELEEVERLKKELLGAVDGDDYLKEQVIELRYQNQILREENRSLKEKLEKAYEFMKQFVIGGINLLEKFMEWIGENVKDVGRGR